MSKITDKFKDYALKGGVPVEESKLEGGQKLFRMGMQLPDREVIPVAIIIDGKEDPAVDYQITYSKLAYVKDYNQRGEALDEINRLNRVHTGYFHLCLAGDGEIYLRTLGRVSEDVRPLYEIIMAGQQVLRILVKESKLFKN
ncbi:MULTISPECIES: hypothetical protein [Aerococcus]|uniref:hypothetical protein n=1 Tax=Aerococcus TaxID=1375 RepID=UPI000200E7B2|nr:MULTISPECIES: hypothetical protein [Aerococcus]AEA00208.1 hypothetical protein HMPREF9243_1597 [Aerococcus sp. Group 1]MCY3030153.1 hypothetical protein [Aerococcus sp. Group 1]MCY3055303.1 hypothetical protein [Aerococcus sp. Group 1]MCY3057033.1 hypothetical protein [Aerococcus sp. Group 1]MCY3061050.1 hypothetical protein [Aerococcus sp. Group 1]